MRSCLGILVLGVLCCLLSLCYVFGLSLAWSESANARYLSFTAINDEHLESDIKIQSPSSISHSLKTAPKILRRAQKDSNNNNNDNNNEPAPKKKKPQTRTKQWTAEEDIKLLEMRELDIFTWEDIAAHFDGRTVSALRTRFWRIMSQRDELTRRGDYWTPAEDAKLLRLVGQGLRSEDIAEALSDRTQAGVNARYTYLTGETIDSESGRGKKYTEKEDALLLQLGGRKDMKWKEKAEFFPRRSQRSVEVRYHKLMKMLKDQET